MAKKVYVEAYERSNGTQVAAHYRKHRGATATRKQAPRPTAPRSDSGITRHPFLAKRGIVEAFLVARIDDYQIYRQTSRNAFAGSMHNPSRGGLLWANYEDAKAAAIYATQKNAGQQYGVFRLLCIAEEQCAPVKVTPV